MSRLMHRSKPSEPTFWRTSAKKAASWFLQCFSLSFVSSEDLGGIASLVLPWLQMAAEGYESGYESGMNRGYESGDRVFSTGKTPRVPQEHKDSLCFTATVAQDRQLFPPRRQTAGSKLQVSSSAAASLPQRPASPSVLRQAAPPRHSTTDATDNSSTRTSPGLLYNSIHWHFPLKIASRDRAECQGTPLEPKWPPHEQPVSV